MTEQTIFADGLKALRPRENAPEWIKADISINVTEFTAFLHEHAKGDGTVRLQIKEGRGGKFYASLDQWSKEAPRSSTGPGIEYPKDEVNPSDVPF